LVAIDTDTAGNDDSTVGTIDSCVSLNINDTIDFDLVVKGVDPGDKIAGYQFDIDIDSTVISVLNITDVDSRGSNPPNDITMISRINSTGGAGFIALSDSATNPDSITVAAADGTADAYANVAGIQDTPLMHEPGDISNSIDDDADTVVDNAGEASQDGVLARISIQATANGTSPLTIPSTQGGADGFNDTMIVAGTFPVGHHIPITTLQSAQVVVGETCPSTLMDADSDGFVNGVEGLVGTDPGDACADTLSPNDERGPRFGEPLSPRPTDFDDNQVINLSDIMQVLPPYLGTSAGNASYDERRDLVPDGVINISDVFKVLPPVFGSSCT